MKEIADRIKETISKQKELFETDKTKETAFRIKALKTLRNAILKHEDNLKKAMWEDLHKSDFDAFNTELGLVLKDLNHSIRNIRKWTRPKRVGNSLIHIKSRSYIYSQPFGRTLIIAPWNYPFLLLINPLIASISGGNCTTLKPSPHAPNTAKAIEQMLRDSFDENYICVFHGGREVNQALLAEKYDYIFFTGSTNLGKIVMHEAAKNLTPVTLELGGKSPCIVDEDANQNRAVRRIVWGKYLNAGQTCIAPDYLMVHASIKQAFIKKLKQETIKIWGEDPIENEAYTRIVDKANVKRLAEYLKSGNIVAGGKYDVDKNYFAPTIIEHVAEDDLIMKEEVFGPILPVLTFKKLNEAIAFVNSRPKPLAFYYFSQNKKKARQVINATSAGGGCINDTVLHIANHNLPFGGVGQSGFGRYHGKYGFDTFTNKRSIMKKSVWLDVPFRYRNTKFNKWLIRKLLVNKLGI